MAKITTHITLDVSKRSRLQAIAAKQYDRNSRYINVRLTNQGDFINIPLGSLVTINAERPDFQSKSFAGEVNADGTVTVHIAYWMLELEGIVSCDISVEDAQSVKLSSLNFTIEVEHANYSGTEISDDDPQYDVFIQVLAGEADRVAAENERKANETERKTSEAARAQAETTRQTNESTRRDNEAVRITNENARIAEEQNRAQAENARAQEFSTWEKQIDTIDSRSIRNSKRITNLEQGLPDDENYTDATVAYTKDVPSNALPYAEVKKIGGMTRKCGNLLPYPYTAGDVGTVIESNGGKIEVLQGGGLSLSGTPTGYIGLRLYSGALLFKGEQTISLQGTFANYYAMVFLYDSPSAATHLAQITINKPTTFNTNDYPTATYMIIDTSRNSSNVAISGIVYPMLNEGSTALPYEPYFKGLRDAKTTEMKSVGVNLIPAFNIGIGINDSTGEIGTNSSKACTDFIQINPNESYMWSGIVKTLTSCVYFYNAQKEYMGRCGASSRDSLLVTKALLTSNLTNVGGEISYIRLWQSENVNLTGTIDMVDNSNQMLNKGAEALPYAPYMESTLPIPEAVQALDGYGWGINADCYNYVDWEKKQFVKRVGVVDMGMISWSDTAYPYTFRSGVENLKAPDIAIERATGFIITKYPPSSNVNYTNIDDKSAIRYQANILVRDSDYADAATFKSAMQGAMLYYELATPEVTDISDLLPEDNFIEVEGNGSITAVNEYGYDVPSEIEYQLEV